MANKQDKPQPQAKTVLGHVFKPFDDLDWNCFAGAEQGSMICYLNGMWADDPDNIDPTTVTTLILSPDGKTVYEIQVDGDERVWELAR